MGQPQLDKGNEIRTVAINGLETRGNNPKTTTIIGYATVFDEFTLLQDSWGEKFYEQINRAAVINTLADDHEIFALKNHNWEKVIGRTGANLKLENHERGLYFELDVPNTTLGKDMIEEVRGGLITGCSIGFRVNDQNWEEKDGKWFRTITDLELREITFTPIPAYSQTSVEVRSLTQLYPSKPKMQINQDELNERQAIFDEANEIYQQLGGFNPCQRYTR
jgi:uncharacterized protein